jgi:hypothetical protein
MEGQATVDLTARIIAIASFVGVIVGPVITNLIMALQAGAERREARRKGRLDYLIGIMKSLIQLRAELQPLRGGARPDEIFAEAFATMLSIPDEEMRGFAAQAMATTDTGAPAWDDRVAAINGAIERMGDLVAGAMSGKR